MKKINPADIILDKEEQWFEDHAEEFVQAPANLRDKLIKAAANTQNKTERMNIRMSKSDMENLKSIASKEGLPYQSLVTSILHKYTSGLLVDINEAKKILRLKERA
ncbi:MAG TPA: antitoxin [Treponemataceae bacterium]|jgi:predicted DNA binding CopG/RHH family protein|nr:antitoxin [Treponemataceae bacterium]